MIIKETKLKGCVILEPKIFKDERGYFFESFNKSALEKVIGQVINFVQDNQSYSLHGVSAEYSGKCEQLFFTRG